jgi:hypothetical protein
MESGCGGLLRVKLRFGKDFEAAAEGYYGGRQ